jgi:glycosyltransferase involved in cell wall biosynthesis
MKKLSILLLTHNRPKLFERALGAIIKQLRPEIEVIVNNDSNDIVEIEHPQVEYHYKQFEHLTGIYKFLYNISSGEYIYFAEDDDYITSDFIESIWNELSSDVIIGNYNPVFNPDFKIDAMSYVLNSHMDEFLLQLSQHIFKKDSIRGFDWPKDSDIHNDILLVKHALKNNNYKLINKVFFYQTADGHDNISFPESRPQNGI